MHILIVLVLHLFCLSQSTDIVVFSTNVTFEPYYHFAINVISPLIPSDATFQLNVSYLASNNDPTSAVTIYSDNLVKDVKSKTYEIWNYQSTTQTVNIVILSNVTLSTKRNLLTIGKQQMNSLFTAVLDHDVTNGYMLPFNLFNDKAQRIFVVEYGGTPQTKSYNMQPYLSTYWTSFQNIITFMPWLPFFSECSFESPNIMLNDLILPKNCIVDQQGMACPDRQLEMTCILQELQVVNVDQQFWFNHKKNIIYYLLPYQLSLSDYLFYTSNSDQLNAQIGEYYYNLIPMIYTRQSSDLIMVNVFDIFFNVDFTSSNTFQIVTASTIGSYDASIATPAARTTVHVHYLSWWDNFVLYNQPFYYYIGFAFALSFVLFCLIYYLQQKIGGLQFQKKVKILVVPAVKGLLYTLITGGSFTVMMYVISSQTNFESIGAVFGGTLAGDALILNNKGRDGLVLMFTGIFLMSASLQQAFKVSSSEQLKIVLQDDKKLSGDEYEMQAKIEFIKKNMYSHRRTMLLAFLVMVFIFLTVLFNLIFMEPFVIAIFHIVFFPIAAKIIVEMHKYFVIRDLLYISGEYVMMILSTVFYFSKNTTLYQFIYLYITKFVLMLFLNFYMQIFYQYLILKISSNQGTNCVARFFNHYFKTVIEDKLKQSEYERCLYYSAIVGNKMLGILMFPFVYLILILTQKSSLLPQTLLIRQESLTLPLLMGVILIPLQIYSLFFRVEVLRRYFGLRIEECIKFNRFKFKRRRFRWMNDEFAHSRDIHPFYRQFQKFGFSSQLYFTVSMMATGLFTTILGVMTIINTDYIFYNDPALLPIFLTVWICGQILSVLVSVLAVKLKLYQKGQEETMRQSFVKIEKYLKLNDTADYLELQGVKDYFMKYNREWIIFNFNKIFKREDLEQNNAELITKYKYYKSIFKKKQIEEKRRIKKIKQSHGSHKQQVILDRNKPIRFDQHGFNYLAKPMMYYWFYLAKQNIYLKGLVSCVKKEQIKSTCEYCNMDVELQVLQRKQFYQLVNSYRLINVGRLFDERAFLQYYRINQQHITICSECKDKNLHLQTKISTKSTAAKIVLRWLFQARSRLLHSKTN